MKRSWWWCLPVEMTIGLGYLAVFPKAANQPKEMAIITIIIWLAPWAGKMNQIVRCDWLPEQARWSHLARSGLASKQNFTKSHITNPLLTKLVQSRWLDIGLVLFFASLCSSRSINKQKKTSHLVNNPYLDSWLSFLLLFPFEERQRKVKNL